MLFVLVPTKSDTSDLSDSTQAVIRHHFPRIFLPIYKAYSHYHSLLTQYERDIETGLDYAQARYYSSAHGRFTSCDPLMASANVINPKSWNRYSYVTNNPLGYIDPDGMLSVPLNNKDQQQQQRQPLPPPAPLPLPPGPISNPFERMPAPQRSSQAAPDIFEVGLPPVPPVGAPIPALAGKIMLPGEQTSRTSIISRTRIEFFDQYGKRLQSDGQTYEVNETIIEEFRTPDVPEGEPSLGSDAVNTEGSVLDTHVLRPNRNDNFAVFTDNMRYARKQIITVTDVNTEKTFTVGLFKLETTLSGLTITNCNRGCP